MTHTSIQYVLFAALVISAVSARDLLANKCGGVDDLCRDAIPTLSWGATPPLPTCCVAGTTCTFISRYSRCLKNHVNCQTVHAIMTNWYVPKGQTNPFKTTLAIIKDAGLLGKLQAVGSKTFFAPTEAAWAKFKAAKGQAAFNQFKNKSFVSKWLNLVLVPNAIGNGGGARVYVAGKMVVDSNLYRITGPASAGNLASVTSDFKCTVTSKRDYVLDTDTVHLPGKGGDPAPWDPPV